MAEHSAAAFEATIMRHSARLDMPYNRTGSGCSRSIPGFDDDSSEWQGAIRGLLPSAPHFIFSGRQVAPVSNRRMSCHLVSVEPFRFLSCSIDVHQWSLPHAPYDCMRVNTE